MNVWIMYRQNIYGNIFVFVKRLETVNFPSKTQVYRTQKICCPDETNCKNPGTGESLF